MQYLITDIAKREGTGKKGHWVNYTLTFDGGLKASAFTTALPILATLKIGDTIEAEIIEDGQYHNIKSLEVVEKAQAGSAATSTQAEPPAQDDIRISIERQTSVKIVFEFGVNPDDEDWSIEKALNQAEQVYQWIHSGILPKATIRPQETQGMAQKPEVVAEQGNAGDSPFPVDDLLDKVKIKMQFANNDTARKWLNAQGFKDERIDKAPALVWKDVCVLKGWS